MKTLALIRHAKSSWKHNQLEDYQRPLNKRGQRDAPLMANRFARLEPKPDLLVSSHALRAWTTAKIFAHSMEYPAEHIKLKVEIYQAWSETLMKIISALPDKYQRVALFGHNPGFTELVNTLTKENLTNLPTAGIAVIELPITEWKDMMEVADERTGMLVYFSYPKCDN